MSDRTPSGTIAAIAELATQVRQSTLRLLQVPNQALLTWAPAGTSNHILWHAGHAVWLQDLLTIVPLTGGSELPDGWAAKFGQNSQPQRVSEWPDVAQVRAQLESQLQRILQLLTEKADLIASEPNLTSRENGWPLVPGMFHGWHDEARHQGEMYLLHKLRGAK